MVRSIKKPFSKMKLLLSQINYSSAGKNYIENRLAVKLIMFWAMCLLLALPWSVSLWQCSHQPWISTPHLLGIMCWVLLLATWHEFPNIVGEMWDLGRAPQGTFAYVDGWQNTRVPPAPSKQEKQILQKAFLHQLPQVWCVVTLAEGKDFFCLYKGEF